MIPRTIASSALMAARDGTGLRGMRPNHVNNRDFSCETLVNAAVQAEIAPYHSSRLMISPPGTVRLAVIDTDSGFVRVLSKRLEAAGWEHRTLSSTVPAEELV